MAGVAGRSGRRLISDRLAVLRGTRRAVKPVTSSKAALARLADLQAAYAFHRALYARLRADTDAMTDQAVPRDTLTKWLREVRAQADVLLRLGAALDRL